MYNFANYPLRLQIRSKSFWKANRLETREPRDGIDPIHEEDEYGNTALFYAVLDGEDDLVRSFLEQEDIKPNHRNVWGDMPLALAAMFRHEVVARLLLQRKDIQTDIKNGFGRTPLSFAAQEGQKEIVRLLLSSDAQADSAD